MSLSGNQRTRLGVGGPSPAYLPIQDKAETVVTINLGHAIRLSKDTKKIILSEGKITHDVINELQLFQMDPPRTGIFLGEAIPGNDYIVYTSSFHDTDVNNENVLTQAGAVFFRDYASDGWTNQIKITAPTREASARFGQVVSISGQNILTNAPWESSLEGAAYVIKRTNGIPAVFKRISEGVAGEYFGWCLDCDDSFETFVITSPWATSGGNATAGIARVYSWDGTTETLLATLTASDEGVNNRLGYQAQISGDGDTIILAAYTSDAQGKVYVYEKGSAWADSTENNSLISDTPIPFTGYGAGDAGFGIQNFALTPLAISYDGRTIIIAEEYGISGGSGSGSVYFYYDLTQKARVDGEVNGFIGSSVYLSPDDEYAVQGDQVATVNSVSNAGRAKLYKMNNGTPTLLETITHSTPGIDEFFGFRTSMNNEHIAVVASDYNGATSDEGAVIMYRYRHNLNNIIRLSKDTKKIIL